MPFARRPSFDCRRNEWSSWASRLRCKSMLRSVWSVGVLRDGGTVLCRIGLVTIAALAAFGCDVNAALEQVAQARHHSAELLVQFTKAADAANKSVMAA